MSEKEKKKNSEDPKIDEILDSSRRDFLKKVGLVGAASVAGAVAVYSGYHSLICYFCLPPGDSLFMF